MRIGSIWFVMTQQGYLHKPSLFNGVGPAHANRLYHLPVCFRLVLFQLAISDGRAEEKGVEFSILLAQSSCGLRNIFSNSI